MVEYTAKSKVAAVQAAPVWLDADATIEKSISLIAEAARIVRPGGKVAFTDWLAGPAPMSAAEAERFLRFMKFPNLLDVDDYRKLLDDCGCRVETAEDTGRFASHVDLLFGAPGIDVDTVRAGLRA